MNHSQLAHEYHMKGYNCSQSLLAAFSDVTGLSETESLSVSGCFGRGGGLRGAVRSYLRCHDGAGNADACGHQ